MKSNNFPALLDMKTEKLCLNGISNKASAVGIKKCCKHYYKTIHKKNNNKNFTKIPILEQTTLKYKKLQIIWINRKCTYEVILF